MMVILIQIKMNSIILLGIQKMNIILEYIDNMQKDRGMRKVDKIAREMDIDRGIYNFKCYNNNSG